MSTDLRAPFPYPGGKRKVADVVWRALGADVPNAIEPFFGSGAWMLARPGGAGGIETVNDIDGGIVNFWRAVSAVPDEVAAWCDWPVTELDLHARHAWLFERLTTMREELRGDPHFYDAKVAGWWVWGIGTWIGPRWCSEVSIRVRQRPHLGHKGKGVHGSRDPGERFRALQNRLRRVRVTCGDWSRVLGEGTLRAGPCAGVFLDPPYAHDVRDPNLYAHEDSDVSRLVREWCLEHGNDRNLRICLAGYWNEHGPSMPGTWKAFRWNADNGEHAAGNANGREETLWFSPHCLPFQGQPSLFDAMGATR